MSRVVGEREQDDQDLERYSKRPRLDIQDRDHTQESTLPPSSALLGVPPPIVRDDAPINFMEAHVGISEYIGRDVSKIEGIIKQRFTDFLVFEVDLDSNVMHLKSLEMPKSQADISSTGLPPGEAKSGVSSPCVSTPNVDTPEEVAGETESNEAWPERFSTKLSAFLSEKVISEVKQLFLEGPESPFVSDSGWEGRASRPTPDQGGRDTAIDGGAIAGSAETMAESKRGKGSQRGRGRARRLLQREDNRKVLSDPIASKITRTALHQTIRELFSGKLDSETATGHPNADSESGSRITIRWAGRGHGRGGGRGGRGGKDEHGQRGQRGIYPPYIHFTMQKTNRDTQDALGHLARVLHVTVKDLSVAGTKDKRGVTVQRVSLRRNNKTVEDVWRLANCQNRRSPNQALTQRGERGIRIADLNYRKASLELGMLKGNAFVITLRNVKVDSIEALDEALKSVKTRGFINYYGMQRFGTASVPTHSIGLALLKSEWQKAVSLILQKRRGEHPDVEAARDAWLRDGDLDKALELMPRRVVAERCILESFKKQGGETRNAMGALSTIPRNLRLMYIHAYQSYVWNAIVSERIRAYGADKPVVGDLVFESPEVDGQQMAIDDEVQLDAGETAQDAQEPSSSRKKSRKPWTPPRIKTLEESDLNKYTVFDVIMPLPGTDVAYPGGWLGERYKEFLRRDGLDPDNFVRKQKEYTLNGSYRSVLHLPKELTWSVLRYTDPDVPLAQADEDKLLGFEPPVVSEDGKFMALQLHITLGTAAYATMALREITKTETSSHHQTSLTNAAEDQKYRGSESTGVTDTVDEVS